MITDKVWKWLEAALDNGITEAAFWNMTLGELDRAIESKVRVREYEEKNKAYFDYTLALLVGRNVARIYNSSNTIPPIEEAYAYIFQKQTPEAEAERQAKRNELSAIRFKQFAQEYNKKFKRGE